MTTTMTETDQPSEFFEWEDRMSRACLGTVREHAETLLEYGVPIDAFMLRVIEATVDPIIDFFRGERGVRDTEADLVEDLVRFFTASLCREPLTVKALRAVYLEYGFGDEPPKDGILSRALDEAMATAMPYVRQRSPGLAADIGHSLIT